MLRLRTLVLGLTAAVLAAATSPAQQVSIWLTQPPPNQLKIADLWKVDVTNNTGRAFKAYVHGTAEELSVPDGIIADAHTAVVDIPPGRTRLTGATLQPVDVDEYKPRYYDALLTTGNVPSGEYQICVELIDDETSALLARDCKIVVVTRMSVPILISPPDLSEVVEKYPVFTWMPSVPPLPGQDLRYRLRVAEVFGRQTPQDAMDRNPAWFELTDLKRTIQQYPISMRGMDVGRSYAWKVEAFEIRGAERVSLGESEVWQFTYQPLDGQQDDDQQTRSAGGATAVGDSTCPGDNWDFELGTLACWDVTGGAFLDDPIKDQHPVLGSNGHHASWWVSSYGLFDGDQAQGAMTSVQFEITKNTVAFLFGGLSDRQTGVDLLVEKGAKDTFSLPLRTLPGSSKEWYVARSTTSTDQAGGSERLVPIEWDVTPFLNHTAFVVVRDSSLVGHINVDHFQFIDKEIKDSIKLPVLVMAAGENHSLAATPNDTPPMTIVDKLRGDARGVKGGNVSVQDVNVVNQTSPNLKGRMASAVKTVTFKSGDGDDDDDGSPLPDIGKVQSNQKVMSAQAMSNLAGLLAKQPNVVWGWGDNTDKSVGPSMPSVVKEPAKISGLTNVQALTAGPWNSLAVGNDGSLWGWGENEHAQLGLGDRKAMASPKKNPHTQSLATVSNGAFHTLGLTAKGELMVWGWNHHHALGLIMTDHVNSGTGQVDSTIFLYKPYPMEGITNVQAIATGEAHSVYLKVNGTVYAAGYNDHGQTGQPLDEPITDRFTKVPIEGGRAADTKTARSSGQRALAMPAATGIVAIAAGFDHSLALRSNGKVIAWGGNASGQLGNGSTTDSPTPVMVKNLTGICAIAAGDGFSMALDTNGRVFAWGNNVLGQLGDGTRVGKWEPVQITTLDAVQGIVAGGSHAMAVRADGGLWTWGTNDYGQLGEGPVVNLLPVPVDPPVGPLRVERLAEGKK